jgi:hypothetical protein
MKAWNLGVELPNETFAYLFSIQGGCFFDFSVENRFLALGPVTRKNPLTTCRPSPGPYPRKCKRMKGTANNMAGFIADVWGTARAGHHKFH